MPAGITHDNERRSLFQSKDTPMILPIDQQHTIMAESDRAREDLVALTQTLISCRTDSQSEGNDLFAPEALRCQDIIADRLTAIGMTVERTQEPPRYPVIAATSPGTGEGRSLAINGHIDVVPVGDASSWSHDPWSGEVADGKLWGRGACDMKGGVAAAIIALEVLHRAGIELRGDVHLHIVSDEEVVGSGTRRLAERMTPVDAVLNAEPTELKMMPVEGGLVHVRIEVEGRESHAGNRYKSVHAGGRASDAGVNAIEKTLKIVTALQELEREWATHRNHPMLPPGFNTILPGIIAGGPGGGQDGQLNLISNPGTTPNYCSVEYNVWYLPHETLEGIQNEIETYVAGVCALDPWLKEHPPRFTWKLRNVWFPPVDTSPDHPFIRTLAANMQSIGIEPRVEAFTAASELAWYAQQGMSGTIFGPGSIAQAHSPDEFVTLSDLTQACTAMALTIADWSG
ncbi:MAG: M20 family metallopeptidase [Thermomicrobiales bacterium]